MKIYCRNCYNFDVEGKKCIARNRSFDEIKGTMVDVCRGSCNVLNSGNDCKYFVRKDFLVKHYKEE